MKINNEILRSFQFCFFFFSFFGIAIRKHLNWIEKEIKCLLKITMNKIKYRKSVPEKKNNNNLHHYA